MRTVCVLTFNNCTGWADVLHPQPEHKPCPCFWYLFTTLSFMEFSEAGMLYIQEVSSGPCFVGGERGGQPLTENVQGLTVMCWTVLSLGTPFFKCDRHRWGCLLIRWRFVKNCQSHFNVLSLVNWLIRAVWYTYTLIPDSLTQSATAPLTLTFERGHWGHH